MFEKLGSTKNNKKAVKIFDEKVNWPSLVVDFTSILHIAFMRADPKSAKKIDGLTVFFALLGSAFVKASFKMWLKLIPGGRPFYHKNMYL